MARARVIMIPDPNSVLTLNLPNPEPNPNPKQERPLWHAQYELASALTTHRGAPSMHYP